MEARYKSSICAITRVPYNTCHYLTSRAKENTISNITMRDFHVEGGIIQRFMVSAGSWRPSLLKIGCTTVALLALETAWPSIANYSFSELLTYTSPLQIFGGLAVGQVIGVLYVRSWAYRYKLLAAIIFVSCAWAGIVYLGTMSVIWLSLPFVGFGILLVDLFSTESLWRLVLISGLAGAAYFSVFLPFVNSPPEYLVLFSLVLLVVAGSAEKGAEKKTRATAAGVVLVVLVFVLWQQGLLAIPSHLQRAHESFRNAERLAPPQINLLFRTDLLFLPALDLRVLAMNGSRLMKLPTPEHVLEKLHNPQEKLQIVYDVPYQFDRAFKSVLVLGSAEGANVLSALAYGADSVTAVDINPAVFYFLKNRYPELIGNLYTDPRVETVRMEGRHFLETTKQSFDLITLQGVQTGTQAEYSSTALIESFLFTEEALSAMWGRLNEGGAIFFDEYESRPGYWNILNTIARTARDALPLTDPARQIFLYRYLQSAKHPFSSDGVQDTRNGLVILKTPVSGDASSFVADVERKIAVNAIGGSISFVPWDTPQDHVPVTDNRPFFVRDIGAGLDTYWLMLMFVALLIGSLFVLRRAQPPAVSAASSSVNIGLFALGAAYMLVVMSFWGPFTLLIGEPFVVGPIAYFGLYFFGLLGGLLALHMRRFQVPIMFGAGLFGVVAAWLTVSGLQQSILGSETMALRYAVTIGAVGLLAVSFEFPYIAGLKSSNGVHRGVAYTYENLGTLLGACTALIAQPLFGFWGSFAAGAVLFIVAGLLFHRGRSAL